MYVCMHVCIHIHISGQLTSLTIIFTSVQPRLTD